MAIALVGLSSNAHAIGFGRMQVFSALGQPLRAEVELLDAKSGSVKAGLAPADTYSQKGIDYNPIVSGIRASVQQGSNGRTVIRLSSDRPLNDPFLDVVLQASDASGSVTRDFSILLDPPGSAKTLAPVAAPQVSRAPVAAREKIVVAEPSPQPAEKMAQTRSRTAGDSARKSRKIRTGAVRVHQGDTAGAIAVARKPANVSLDQMLLAMLKANPNAFIDGNVNRLKAGAVLQMPTAQQAQATSRTEARSAIMAQSSDFRGYRNKLAKSTTSQATPDAHKSGGNVQANVKDTQTTPSSAPDALTLSKGSVKSTTEDRIAKAAEKKANTNRTEELNKNLDDLKKLSNAAASAPVAGSAKVAASAPGIQVNTPAAVAAANATAVAASAAHSADALVKTAANAASAAVLVAPAASAASAAASAATAVANAASAANAAANVAAANAASAAVAAASVAPAPQKPSVKVAPPAPEPAPEPGFLEGLLQNPATLAGGAGILALLGGLAAWRLRQRRAAQGGAGENSAFLESNITHDSFFHASGGKNVDTSESGSTDMNQSSMLYSPSQLDAEADVDPVSEADVYLAYGRDIQAEEILKDALNKNPSRTAIYTKLLEIYSRRRDAQAYAQTATELKRLTNGSGQDWEIACKNGFALEPGNPLYADAAGQAGAESQGVPEILAPTSRPSQHDSLNAPSTVAEESAPAIAPLPEAIIDPSAHFEAPAPAAPVLPAIAAAAPAVAAGHTHAAQAKSSTINSALLQQPTMSPSTMPMSTNVPIDAFVGSKHRSEGESIDLSLDLPELTSSQALSANAATPAKDDKAMEFDMSALSLDLDKPAAPAITGANDGMSTKLALAGEFLAIGDKEGARTMAEEVAKHASGDLQQKAKEFLRNMG